ncbi:MAG TPA: 6-carboxytetrahydropterin synthase [Bryobacteraceae bacterium]|jgi:6-pyruvoyltetrahydropterin/6-carboxytetrahydropterin synthase
MFVTRKAEFSASHVCRLPNLEEAENRALFGEEANPNGHGHNYVLEVTLEGEPDPVTGMVMDLKRVKDILEEEVVEPMDHRFLNREVPPFDRIVPTTANVAREIWRRLESRFDSPGFRLARLRLYETRDCFVEIVAENKREDASLDEEIAA